MLKDLWTGWKHFAQKIGDFQARLILTVLYFLVLGPFGLFMSLLRDPLRVKHPPERSQWTPRPADLPTLETSRRQF